MLQQLLLIPTHLRIQKTDISFKSLLISKPSNWQGINGEHYTVHLELAENKVEI